MLINENKSLKIMQKNKILPRFIFRIENRPGAIRNIYLSQMQSVVR